MCTINQNGLCIMKRDLTSYEMNKIKVELTVKPYINFGNFHVKSFKVYRENQDYIIIPIYYGLGLDFIRSPEVRFINDITIDHDIEDLIILRDNQKECFNNCYNEFSKDYGGGLITLSTGSGKTILTLKLIAVSKLKTMIILNKIELLNQWREQIRRWLPNIRIGIIQGNKFDYEDCDIILGMLQTISMKDKLKAIDFQFISACYIDECHNISTEVFSNIMFKVRPRYLFGLTATLERKDKLERVIKWYIGDILYDNSSNELKQSTEVYIYKYKGESSVIKMLRDNITAAVSSMVTNIANDRVRTDYIINIIKELIDEVDGRNILVISDRINLLKEIHKKFPIDSGLFIGGMKSDELQKTKERRIILGTYGLVNEGFDVPKLNCIIFATPRSNIVQAIGRIYRKDHEIVPRIIDIWDNFSIFNGQYYKRLSTYKKSIKGLTVFHKHFGNING